MSQRTASIKLKTWIAGLAVGLSVAGIFYALLVNAIAGLQYRTAELNKTLEKVENEMAKSQIELLEKHNSAVADASGHAIMMQDIGSDLSYVHSNSLVVDASARGF